MANRNLTRSLKMLLMLVCTCSYLGAFAQIKVTGRVTGTNGTPLAGATVLVKDQKGGTTTDAKGDYTLNAANGNVTLQFSYIGYEIVEMPLNNRTIVNVTMKEDANVLEELLVVGYGSQRKMHVTGSVAQVGRTELKTTTSGNLSASLQGRLPGLISLQTSGQPGRDGISILVRGYNSTQGGGPLVIVDGVERDFPNVTADEIETITILKDASAAQYGIKGSNGVMIIKTRRGKNIDGKPRITLSSQMSLANATSFPGFLNGPEYVHWYDKAQAMDGVDPSNRRFTPDQMNRIINGDDSGMYSNTDWFDELLGTAKTFTNNVSVEGGTENLTYFINVGAYNQGGLMEKTSFDRYNIRTNIEAKISKRLKVDLGIAAFQTFHKEPAASAGPGIQYASIFSQAMFSHPYLPTSYNGEPTATFLGANRDNNPLAARDLSGFNNARGLSLQTNAKFTYDIPGVKGLQAGFTGAYDRSNNMVKAGVTPYYVQAFNPATRQYNRQYAKMAGAGVTALNQWYTERYRYMVQPSISYDNTFGKHNVSGMMLYEYANVEDSNLSVGVKDFAINTLLEVRFAGTIDPQMIKGNTTIGKRAGYVGRLNYNYDNKYMVEFTGRYDGTPMLPAKSRWGFFPNVSLGWRVSEEPFFKDNVDAEFMDNLKLRASIGKLGSEGGLGYNWLGTSNISTNPVVVLGSTPTNSIVPGGIFNPDLKWATTTTYNVGVEANMWKGLLGVELDVFYMYTQDIIESISNTIAPSMGGYYVSSFNYGKVDNRGFELVLNHKNKIGDFSYNVRGNVSWARNKVLRTNEDFTRPSNLQLTGHAMGRKFGLIADGIYQTQAEIDNSAVHGARGNIMPGDIRLVDVNGDGVVDLTQDWSPIGRSNTPEVMFGLNLSGEWRGFDISVFLQGAAVRDVALCGLYDDRMLWDDTFYTRPFYSDGNTPRFLVENSWTPENTGAKYPRLGITERDNGGKWSSLWVENGNYLRLKSAQIGYTLPRSFLKKVNIDQIRVFATGNNLFTLSHLPYLDPEMPDTNQGYYPQTRVFEFGVTLTF